MYLFHCNIQTNAGGDETTSAFAVTHHRSLVTTGSHNWLFGLTPTVILPGTLGLAPSSGPRPGNGRTRRLQQRGRPRAGDRRTRRQQRQRQQRGRPRVAMTTTETAMFRGRGGGGRAIAVVAAAATVVVTTASTTMQHSDGGRHNKSTIN